MKQTIGFSQFCDAFSDTYRNNFTYNGKRALFDYLKQYEEDTGEEIELDTVALCCEYSEYESAVDAMKAYNEDAGIVQADTEGMDLVEIAELAEKEAREWLEERTTVIPVDGFDYSNGIDNAPEVHGVIIQDF